MVLSIIMEKWLLMKNIVEYKNPTLFMAKMAKISAQFMSQRAEKPYHTLWGRSYLYSSCKGVLPPAPSTLRRRKLKTGFFLRLGLPSTLTRRENRAFQKRSSNRRNLKTPAFHFRVDRKHFVNGAFRKRRRHDNYVISPDRVFSNKNLE